MASKNNHITLWRKVCTQRFPWQHLRQNIGAPSRDDDLFQPIVWRGAGWERWEWAEPSPDLKKKRKKIHCGLFCVCVSVLVCLRLWGQWHYWGAGSQRRPGAWTDYTRTSGAASGRIRWPFRPFQAQLGERKHESGGNKRWPTLLLSPLLLHSHYPSIQFTQPIKAAWFRLVRVCRYDPLPAGNSSYFLFANAAVCVSNHQSGSLGARRGLRCQAQKHFKKKTLTCGALGNHIYSQVETAGLINDGSLFFFPECVRLFWLWDLQEGPAEDPDLITEWDLRHMRLELKRDHVLKQWGESLLEIETYDGVYSKTFAPPWSVQFDRGSKQEAAQCHQDETGECQTKLTFIWWQAEKRSKRNKGTTDFLFGGEEETTAAAHLSFPLTN